MKKRMKKISVVLLVLIVAMVTFWINNRKDAKAYTTENAEKSRTYPYGWATVSMHGPSGDCWLSLKFTYGGSQMTQAEFNDSARNITIEKSNASSSNPYQLQLVTIGNTNKYTTKTALNDNKNYTSIYFYVQYKVPAHETARTQSVNSPEYKVAPYDFSSEGRYASVTTHQTSDRTVTVKLRVSIYSIGICSFKGGGTYTYNRYYGSELRLYTEKKKYRVTYKENGGKVSSSYKDFDCGSNLTFPTATRTGYTLNGWKNDSGTSYTTKNTVCGSDLTLTAQWKPNQYKIHYDANGGSKTMEDSDVSYDASFTLPKNSFTKEGYKFLGWGKDADSSISSYEDEETIRYQTASDMTLYAIWGQSQYKLRLEPNGANEEAKITPMECAKEQEIPKNPFTRAGYTFIGWAKDADAVKVDYQDKELVKDLSEAGKTFRLYAIWKKSDGSFDIHNVIRDDSMFQGDIEIEGGNKTGFSRDHTDSEYARIDKDGQPGYFTSRY